ncbi:adenosine deaminase [Clostridium cellulovorans]|uniref:Adenosine deaminase n=1 Tax=Clostridium cellulovorans (strain ATCC 35296 / DSM 3052 / OCM 3 / 743B) TaxID=573061 RepID=D9SPZ0_CLOC7|nr:adenosine deaminase [Clostridium cellulovorans]ADL52126.1 Adenosine deaminase [Clostridium cellulovorans 743B]
MKHEFIKALENNDLPEMKKIPKSDLHNHATRGGNKRYIGKYYGITIPKHPKFNNLHEMNQWNSQNIKPFIKGRAGYKKRIEAAFVQAKNDGVKVLDMCFEIGEVSEFGGSVERMVQALKSLHNTFAPNVTFIPGIALGSYYPMDEMSRGLEEFLAQDYFKSLDIYGEEEDALKFKSLFRKAKDKGLILKAHVGEFGSAELVQRAVEELELNQVQHGIAAANSKSIMRWLSDNKIILNVCPTSNVYLSRVEDYNVHPIKILYDNGVKVTVNTDDMIIFDASVSEEFFNLYNAGIFAAEELNEIRENGLRAGI